ncbi:aspartyl/asparaginyl beta-hydroxylase domain-containing protein [Burkholderia vietnamiensis]|uniref:aspartyl/asparaginyl beta-hydroxylase domain-containing protein n=1 Tax=Burkholderia vietnamiensis TaxID=60552 RepID=UPI00265320BB|nr:aspartyl/asparaginyl beta-hydroxylase domain-containing protein [Burkholderia vietnamiensis]MDN7409444.1 aspartyl/asparaginyl beta-hydroxylase domain-containing protein [Burkholderia vietnamiensis]
MNNLIRIGAGIDTAPLLLAIARQPGLWNRHTARTDPKGGPHADVSDIWLRYNDEKPYKAAGDYTGFNDAHDAIFYPEWYALPQVRPIVFGLMARVEGTRLGGVLITKIPAGKRVLPHADDNWHVRHYNTKLYVPLQSNAKCWNRVEDETVVMAPGEVWYFDNAKEHEVVNEGDDDRITLIVSIRCEK